MEGQALRACSGMSRLSTVSEERFLIHMYRRHEQIFAGASVDEAIDVDIIVIIVVVATKLRCNDFVFGRLWCRRPQ